MAVTLESSVRPIDDVLFQELHGEGVLLNLKTGVYFGLDPVGRRIWQLLEEHRTLGAIVGALVREYDVSETRAAADLLALAAELERHELIAIG